MKRLLVVLILTLTVGILNSQGHIGKTEDELRAYITENYDTPLIEEDVTDDGTKYLIHHNGALALKGYYYLNPNGIIDYTLIIPLSKQSFSLILQSVEKNQIKINDNEWRVYYKIGYVKTTTVKMKDDPLPIFEMSTILY